MYLKQIVATTNAPHLGDSCEYCGKHIKPNAKRFAVVWGSDYRAETHRFVFDVHPYGDMVGLNEHLAEWSYSNGEVVCSRKCGRELI